MVTVATQIIRKLAGDQIMFNDRLKDGTRSYKVWGWNYKDYIVAQDMLRANGYKVKMVASPAYYDGRGGVYTSSNRLHVSQ